MSEDVLALEGAHLELARQCLAEMRARTESLVGADVAVDEIAANELAKMRARRLAALADDPGTPPFFARIDQVDPAAEVFHIGLFDARSNATMVFGEPASTRNTRGCFATLIGLG